MPTPEKHTALYILQLMGELSLASGYHPPRGSHALALPNRKKARLLLAFLALHPGRHSRVRLCEMLWEDPDHRAALSVELAAIRRCFDLPSGELILRLEGDTVQLNLRWLDTDVTSFESLLRQAAKEPDQRSALRMRLRAIHLYVRCGPLLRAEYKEDWIVTYRDKLAARFQSACADAIGNLIALGRSEWAERALTILLARYPQNETFKTLNLREGVTVRTPLLPAEDNSVSPEQMRRYHALSSAERSLFLSVCLLEGAFSLAAAISLHPVRRKDKCPAQTAHICQVLNRLHQEGFLVVEEHEAGSLFCVPPALRAFGAANISARNRDLFTRRQAAYYCALIQKVRVVDDTPAHVRWQQKIEAEYANIRQTLAFYSRHSNACICAELIVSLSPFWQERNWYQEATRWFRQIHRRRRELPANTYCELRRCRGSLALLRGRTALAFACYRKAQQICKTSEEKKQLAQSFTDLGGIAHHRQQDAQAKRAYEQSLALFATLNLPLQEAGARACLGDTLLLAEGDVEGARQQYEKAADLRKNLSLLTHHADICYRLSEIYRIRGDYGCAISLLDKALHLFGLREERSGEAQCLARLGTLLLDQGRIGTARRLLADSLDFYVESKDAYGEAAARGRLAEAAMWQGDFDRAHGLLQQGLQTWQSANHARWMAAFQVRLARVACYQERFADALVLTEQSLAGYERSPAPFGTAYAHYCRAHALRGLRRKAEAVAALSEPLNFWKRVGYLKGVVEGLELAASLALEEHGWQTAAQRLGKASVLRLQMSVPLPPAEEEIHTRMRNTITARKNWKKLWTAGEQMEFSLLLNF